MKVVMWVPLGTERADFFLSIGWCYANPFSLHKWDTETLSSTQVIFYVYEIVFTIINI